MLDVGSTLTLGVEVLDAGHAADGLDHAVGRDPRAGRHLAGGGGEMSVMLEYKIKTNNCFF